MLLIALVTGALVGLDASNGVPAWRNVRGELARSQQRNEALRAEIDRLQAEATALRDDPLAIESAIREDLGLARPGEIVIHLGADGAR